MGEILVVVEHRKGEVRDISREMLFKAGELCGKASHELVAVVLVDSASDSIVQEVAKMADRALVFRDDRFKNFDSHLYKEVLYRLVEERNPFLTLMGHTSWGMDVAPALAVKSGYPLSTDCVDILVGGWQAVCCAPDLQRQAFFQGFVQGIRRIYGYRETGGFSCAGRGTPERGKNRHA